MVHYTDLLPFFSFCTTACTIVLTLQLVQVLPFSHRFISLQFLNHPPQPQQSAAGTLVDVEEVCSQTFDQYSSCLMSGRFVLHEN